jgi:Trk K+ transport system NAD-binding subunit
MSGRELTILSRADQIRYSIVSRIFQMGLGKLNYPPCANNRCMNAPTPLAIYRRYAQFLLWEFRWPLGVFTVLVLGGGLILRLWYHHRDVGIGYGEACYAVFLLIFLEPMLQFPDEWYLQPLFFILPLIGLGAVADSVVRLGYLIFAQKQRLPEWQRMVASMYRNHIVVLGVGKVGLRIIKGLVELHEPVVAIERVTDSPFLDEVRDLDVPVIAGDGRNRKTLEDAGVAEAKAIILASDDDLANLDAALTARDIQPSIRVVMRLFDDTLAEKIGGTFNMPAISTSHVAAPAFIAAATGRTVYQEFQLDGRHLHLIDLTIHPGSALANCSVGDLQADKEVNIVMHRGAKGVSINPGHEILLAPNDTILVIAPIAQLRTLEAANQ